MEHALLSVHVVAAIVFVGGSAVATSLFPRYAPSTTAANPDVRNPAVAAALHRITGGYAAFGLIVPVVGIALAALQERLGEVWITVAMILTALAALLLATQIHPRQKSALKAPAEGRKLKTLSMLAGVYNLVWAIVVVLMIIRPGSETGA